jgi:hypothetical protein
MTTDPRTEAERRYDAERDGSLYRKPASLMLAVAGFIEQYENADHTALAQEADRIIADTPIDPTEEAAITALLEEFEAHLDPLGARFDAVVDGVFDLPDAQRAQAIALWEGFLAGVQATAQ